ncbi:SigE family RNA polymerase sigma factor [Nocardioides alpinus]|nr:SigE family RNA polymerase sigma factor [Nocardioides alpinus]PKH43868.1 SigE family RNA polymerase sigma factor [Nocardioides alpinus]
MGTTSDKDADFSAYMSARQPALYRTAYLLAGDHAAAEDLLQNAFAKLYLSWDRIRDRGALDGWVRRVIVNEHNSLWRRAWKRREHSTDTLPESGTHDTYDDGRGGALWSYVQTLPPRQRSVVVLRYYEELTEAETADLLGISVGTVKSQTSRALAGLRARAPRSLDPHESSPPRDRRRPMTHTSLEDEVRDALHRRVDPLRRAPLTVTDVRRRARRVQRRRRIAAGAAVAAALAVAVPVGLAMNGPAQRNGIEPATPHSPSITGTVTIDPRSAPIGGGPGVPLVNLADPRLITGDTTLALPESYDQITPYLDGWVAVTNDEGALTVQVLDADFRVVDGDGLPSRGLTVSPDGARVAWTEYDGTRWYVVDRDVAGSREERRTAMPRSAEAAAVTAVGFVSDSEVVVTRTEPGDGTLRTLLADGATVREVPGLLAARTASPATGMVAGLISSDTDSSCSAVVDATARTGEVEWRTCDHTLVSYSPDGAHVVGFASYLDANGSPTMAILNAGTGDTVVDLELAGPARGVVGISEVAWEDSETVLATLVSGADQYVVRVRLDGSVERVEVELGDADPSLVPLVFAGS